jgi:hypothetical protein
VEVGVPGTCDGVLTVAGDDPVRVAIEPLGPWRVRFDPWPFAENRVALTMRRRLVPKREWPDDDAFRTDLAATPFETVRIFAQR